MAKLFVANCTGQRVGVNYRLDFSLDGEGRPLYGQPNRPYRTIYIEPREQIPFGGDWHITQISELVQVLENSCGAVHLNDIKTAKAKGPVKLIWSQDKPIPLAILKDVYLHNVAELSSEGDKRRRRLALAANMGINTAAEGNLQTFEMEFETESSTVDQDLPSPTLEAGLRIINEPGQRPGPKGRSRKAA